MTAHKQLRLGCVMVMALSSSVVAVAQTARPSSGGGASAQAMQQLQQLASERTALQAETRASREIWNRPARSGIP